MLHRGVLVNTLFSLCACSAARQLLARADVLRLGALAASASAPTPALATSLAASATARAYLDLRIIERFDVEVLEDAATRGRLTIALFGKDAPVGVARFVEFLTGTLTPFYANGGGPSYAQSTFDRQRPGELVTGGRIAGLRQTTFAGAQEWEYMGRLLPNLRPVLEVNDLRHDRRGLLTRARFESGPEFGLTLAPAPSLDTTHEVLGQVEGGLELLTQVEALPYITGRSLEEPGSVADSVFNAQKSLFSGLAKGAGDARAEDRTGRLLRRVEITGCGLL